MKTKNTNDFLSVRLGENIKEELEKLARKKDLSVSTLSRNIISNFLKLDEEEQAKFFFGVKSKSVE